MTVAALPSLSDLGWVHDTGVILGKILSLYILTDVGQTVAFQGNLVSLPYTYYLHINEPREMATSVKNDLEKMLGRYFENYEVETVAKEGEDKAVTILIYAHALSPEGERYSLGKVVEMNTEGVRKTIDISNFGDGLSILQGN